MNSLKIKKGDNVKVITGKDRGKIGKVVKTLFLQGKVLIENVNVFKKHVKPKRANEKGQVIFVSRPINVSNVQLLCQACGRPTRIGNKIDGKDKIRFCRKCNAKI